MNQAVYQNFSQLGESAFAQSYRAVSDRLGGDVVVKLYSPRIGSSAEATESFLRVVKAFAGIRHDVMLNPIEAGRSADGQLYVTRQWVEAPSLAEIISADALPIGIARQLTAEIAGALIPLHTLGYAHAALHLHNVFVANSGQITVVDPLPPICLETDPSGYATHPARTVAPELLAGESATTASDVYALAALLLQLIGNHVVPVELETALDEALAPAAGKRPTVDEFAATLRQPSPRRPRTKSPAHASHIDEPTHQHEEANPDPELAPQQSQVTPAAKPVPSTGSHPGLVAEPERPVDPEPTTESETAVESPEPTLQPEAEGSAQPESDANTDMGAEPEPAQAAEMEQQQPAPAASPEVPDAPTIAEVVPDAAQAFRPDVEPPVSVHSPSVDVASPAVEPEVTPDVDLDQTPITTIAVPQTHVGPVNDRPTVQLRPESTEALTSNQYRDAGTGRGAALLAAACLLAIVAAIVWLLYLRDSTESSEPAPESTTTQEPATTTEPNTTPSLSATINVNKYQLIDGPRGQAQLQLSVNIANTSDSAMNLGTASGDRIVAVFGFIGSTFSPAPQGSPSIALPYAPADLGVTTKTPADRTTAIVMNPLGATESFTDSAQASLSTRPSVLTTTDIAANTTVSDSDAVKMRPVIYVPRPSEVVGIGILNSNAELIAFSPGRDWLSATGEI